MARNVLIIVQARMGSSRLPGKVLADINGRPALLKLIERVAAGDLVAEIVVATTTNDCDDVLCDFLHGEGIQFFRGSETDVLGRFYAAALKFGAQQATSIVRITGDDIFPDWRFVAAATNIMASFEGYVDGVFTSSESTFPYGVYVEAFTFEALRRANFEAVDDYDREHVTPYIRKKENGYRIVTIDTGIQFPDISYSIDVQEDLASARKLDAKLSKIGNKMYRYTDLFGFSDGK